MLKLRELRKKNGLTMKELGRKVGVAESTISQYETGKRQADYEILLKISDFFGVSVDYILTGKEPEKTPTPIAEYIQSQDPKQGDFIVKFNSLSPDDQEEILAIIDVKLARKPPEL